MSDVTVLIDAEKIEHEVTQAILDSAIGTQLKKKLEELAEKWKIGAYWDDNLKKVIEQEVNQIIRDKVREAIKPHLEKNIARLVTPHLLNELIEAGMSQLKVESRY